MIFSRDRTGLRRFFLDAWRRYRGGAELGPLERVVTEIVVEHPEYHALLERPDALERDYLPETGEINPFLHLAMHVAIQEQLSTDRPAGVRGLYRSLRARFDSAHELEHAMMECLGETLWQAQRRGSPPDENAYLDCLRRLARDRNVGL